MNELLSVIIPVYQTKKYLNECVSSVLNQHYKNIEIILVDDGSTDGSDVLCDRWADYDARIKVKHIKNSGPFIARKIGVELSRGKIITFVDSDDWVDLDTYMYLMKIYEIYKPDIIAYSYKTSVNGRNSENYYDEGFYSRTEIEKDIISTMMYDVNIGGRKLNPSICCKILKRNIYEKVVSGINKRINWGEDAIITYPAVCMAESIYISRKMYYNYRLNTDSSTHKSPSGIIDEMENFYEEIKKTLFKYDKKYRLKFQIELYMRYFFDMFIMNCFEIHCVGAIYLFPYSDIPYKSRIQIYGAGDVGRAYVLELLQSKYAEIVGWYDKNANELSDFAGVYIDLPEKINEIESDTVIIAIQDGITANKIKDNLVELGIETDKIYWKIPRRRL